MQTTITARHCEISDALRERALTVVERLGHLATRPIEATVVFWSSAIARSAASRRRGSVTFTYHWSLR